MKPTREEVKEYFKEVLDVVCLCYGFEVNITNYSRNVYEHGGNFWIDIKNHVGKNVKLWDEFKGYARIISYVEHNKIDETGVHYIIAKNVLKLHKLSSAKTQTLIESLFHKIFKK